MQSVPVIAALQASAVALLTAAFLLGPQAAPASAKLLDSDGDGCTDAQEFGPEVSLGGQRNPNNFWDFFDTPAGAQPARDKVINVIDIGGVVARFGSTRETPPTKEEALAEALLPPPAAPAYHTAFDRGGAVPGQNPWSLLPPDGRINVIDVGAVVAQFGHTCWQESPTPADSIMLDSEMGESPVFWRPQDEGFQSLRAGEPYKVVIRVTSGYEEETLRIVAEQESGPASAVEFEVSRAEPIGEEAPGSYYPLILELPQPGTWVLTVLAGEDEVSLTVEAASGD